MLTVGNHILQSFIIRRGGFPFGRLPRSRRHLAGLSRLLWFAWIAIRPLQPRCGAIFGGRHPANRPPAIARTSERQLAGEMWYHGTKESCITQTCGIRRKMDRARTFLAIDLKSFYASVECRDRGLDPLTTNLVVADESRTEKTICLAVSPSLKACGIPGRPRLFEVLQRVRQVNRSRKAQNGGAPFTGGSSDSTKLEADPSLELEFITAVPRMRRYMECSAQIYQVYLKYVAPEDIHVYSIDEVFMDVTAYLDTYRMSAHDLCRKIIQDVLEETGITATGGIGTNLYLSKIAMDIVAKHMPADSDGVRIARLDEMSYRRLLWTHRPLTDFWRVGTGIAARLERSGMYTMGDVARISLQNEDVLYDMLGINAAHLIDHAWGYDDVSIAAIHAYKPENSSVGAGQVLMCPYTARKAKVVTREMTEQLVLDLAEKGLVTDQLVLTVNYDRENLSDPERRGRYRGEISTDYYGRSAPKHAHGSAGLGKHTSSTRLITEAMMDLYDRIVDPDLLVRRITIAANHVIGKSEVQEETHRYEQMDLFTDYAALEEERRQEAQELERERRAQEAVLEIRRKFGKNAILKGTNLLEGATGIQRNEQVGGHRG